MHANSCGQVHCIAPNPKDLNLKTFIGTKYPNSYYTTIHIPTYLCNCIFSNNVMVVNFVRCIRLQKKGLKIKHITYLPTFLSTGTIKTWSD